MADNPIKHDDIIQPGNPFEDVIKGIRETNKVLDEMLKDLKKGAKEWQKFTQKQNASTKEGQENLKKAAKATGELSAKEKEALKIKQSLERQEAKLTFLRSKEGQAQLKRIEAAKREERELKKIARAQDAGAKSTNTWGKALGSFAAKFNTIGNIAGIMFDRITQGIKRAISQFTSLEKIIKSNQITSDRFDVVIGRLKGSFEALNRAVALGDFKNFGDQIRAAADAAADYVAALDVLGDTQNALNIQVARTRRQVRELQETYNDTSKANEDRLDALNKAESILLELQSQQERIATARYQAELDRIRGTNQLTKEQEDIIKRFFDNYGLLTDEQVTSLEGLVAETHEITSAQKALQNQATNTTGSMMGLSGSALSVIDNMKLKNDVIGDVKETVSDYENTVKNLSDTMGFDLKPAIDAIVRTNDEQRKSYVESVISYEQQLTATQRLITSLASVRGSIFNKMKSEEISTEATKRNTIAINQNVDAIRRQHDELIQSAQDSGDKILEINNNRYTEDVNNFKWGEDEKKKLFDQTIQAAQQASDALFNYQQRQIDARYDAEIEAAGENAAKLKEIEERRAKEEQDLAIKQALINGAIGATKTIANLGFPLAIPALIAQAAIMALQIATIKSQQFAEGGSGMLDDEGRVLKGPSHAQGGINLSPMIEAEGGEYFGIINKRMTKRYSNELPAIFDSINNGKFHDVFSRSNVLLNKDSIFSDPYTKKTYETLQRMANTYTDTNGDQVVEYMSGKKRIVRQRASNRTA